MDQVGMEDPATTDDDEDEADNAEAGKKLCFVVANLTKKIKMSC